MNLHKYSNLAEWVAKLDVEVENRLITRLEAGIREWTRVLHTDEKQSVRFSVLLEFIVGLRMTSGLRTNQNLKTHFPYVFISHISPCDFLVHLQVSA